jgi:hypothetical protein
MQENKVGFNQKFLKIPKYAMVKKMRFRFRTDLTCDEYALREVWKTMAVSTD